MLTQLADRSPDLARLINEEYDLEIRDTNLLVHNIPYVTEEGAVAYGILVSEISTNGQRTITPGRHEMWLVGEIPHDHQGNKVTILIDEPLQDFGPGLSGRRMSAKRDDQPPADYHIKVTTYVDLLGRYARAIDSSATHRGAPPRESSEDESVFRYLDSATSRSALSAVTAKLKRDKIAIVGLGGTGSYILDLVSKTPVAEIHLYDDDTFHAHNAFRTPGAASFEELISEPSKVEYLQRRYDPIRRSIVSHPVRITEDNLDELGDKEFVFLAMDTGPDKRLIIEWLVAHDIPFIDCGLGVTRVDNSLRGSIRTTVGEPGRYDHIPRRVSFALEADDEYDLNIQTADLNMMNAVFAVVEWKKMLGYYVDDKREMNATYVISRNQLVSGELRV